MRFLLVCLGGALGSGLRYGIGLLAARFWGLSFPWGTLLVNLTGCLLISMVFALAATTAEQSALISPELRLFLATGVMGGLTTYSAFNHEVLTLLQGSGFPRALGYVALTFVGCLVMGLLGGALGRAALAR
jgi:CrcB protein